MNDNTTRKIKDIQVGDTLYGVSEREIKGKKSIYVASKVLAHWKTKEKDAYEIELYNGNKLICSADHRWMTIERGGRYKYTIGTMYTSPMQRPYLTLNSRLAGFGTILDTSKYSESDEYKKGYLSGVIMGDGHLGIHDYTGKRTNRTTDIQYHFRLAMKEEVAIVRTAKYLLYFGIKVNFFSFPLKDRKTKTSIPFLAIRTHKKEHYHFITELIAIKDNSEFLRGYLAGIYDAEGSSGASQGIARIANTDDKILKTAMKGLDSFDIKYVLETVKMNNPERKQMFNIRLIGGVREILKFCQITNPAAKSKFNFNGMTLKTKAGNDLRIKSINYIGRRKMYDITTSTENFIANGVVSHNCYSRRIVENHYSSLLEPKSFITSGYELNEHRGIPYPFGFVPTIHPYRLNEPLEMKQASFIFTASMGDLFDKAFPDEYRREIFRVMEKASWHTFMLITKNPRELKRFINDFGVRNVPKNLWIGVTAENQTKAKQRIPILLSIPKIKCFVIFEPLMGTIDLQMFVNLKSVNKMKYLIVGGMSGPDAVPMNPKWVAGIRDAAQKNKIKFNFKQWGEWEPLANVELQMDSEDIRRFESYTFEDGTIMLRVGHENTTRLLEGREHKDKMLFLGAEKQTQLF